MIAAVHVKGRERAAPRRYAHIQAGGVRGFTRAALHIFIVKEALRSDKGLFVRICRHVDTRVMTRRALAYACMLPR